MTKAELLNCVAFIISTSSCLFAFSAGIRYFHAKKIGRTIVPAVIRMIIALVGIYGAIAIVQIH